MGARYEGQYAGHARQILCERDYEAARRLLSERCKGIYLLIETERMEALIRELTAYEEKRSQGRSNEPDCCSQAGAADGRGWGGDERPESSPRERWSDRGPLR
jgi:hypothetical protein